MASIQCIKCKAGIHYHGEPEGIEYIFINEKDWDKMISSYFDPLNKQYINESDVPKLFRSDTIESDFEEQLIIKAWKCQACGSIVFFDRHGRTIGTYEENQTEETEWNEPNSNYVVFDDFLWNKLTDSAIPNSKIPQYFKPPIYARITESWLALFMNDGEVKKYSRIEELSDQ